MLLSRDTAALLDLNEDDEIEDDGKSSRLSINMDDGTNKQKSKKPTITDRGTHVS